MGRYERDIVVIPLRDLEYRVETEQRLGSSEGCAQQDQVKAEKQS
jgi:hypothetical protein